MANQSPKTRTKANPLAHATQGFGVPLTAAPHHFVVSIPRGNTQPVQIIEDLGMHTAGDDSELLDRVVLPRPAWTEIANPVKRMFNERLKAHQLKPGQWKVGENRIDRLMGKELCVLAWAIEDLAEEKVGAALRNWLALRPEERWWLFGMTAATVGGPDDKGRGWRMALKYALGDTPQPTIREPRKADHQVTNDKIYENLPLFQS
ncbi:anti-phage-associated DUF3780 domain-containing protein [Prochlorothrix hollandica]|uniref:DUF3780 domain-containing protein n=1 Tax=Prochlorothrix hollandica PCC 9006 = CALU 1027 TaxID=317619 RepID=A0A0M2PSR1_PROHO|nr:anti-phage-associated DUF3780 domain-containing protein [Prochlorothrix hollandica]KKI99570.1 hypothetical protein PROH_06475 [Prochlorothrix hollandica PCC 9006 = CALU 1027]